MQEICIWSLGRSPGGGHGNPLQYSCLESPMGRGAWWATVHGVAKSQTWLKRLSISTELRKIRTARSQGASSGVFGGFCGQVLPIQIKKENGFQKVNVCVIWSMDQMRQKQYFPSFLSWELCTEIWVKTELYPTPPLPLGHIQFWSAVDPLGTTCFFYTCI